MLCLLFLLIAHSSCDDLGIFNSAAFDRATRSDKYDRNVLPQLSRNETAQILVGFYVETLSGIRPATMDYDLDIYFRESWTDERLRHNEQSHIVITDVTKMHKIWRPNIYFANSKKADFQDVTKSNFFLLVHGNGTIHLSQRIRMVVSCNMNLRNYPLDEQHCDLRIQPYTIPLPQLNVSWFKQHPIAINQDNKLPELQVVSLKPDYCDGWANFGQTEYGFKRAEFSCLLAKLHLKRLLGYHLTQTYIPTILIVMISWVGFWIDPLAVPARISLSFTTLLTLATANTGVRMSLPPVSYAKAIDYWMGMCMSFVFMALIEFIMVNMMIRMAKKNEIQLTTELEGNKEATALLDSEDHLVENYTQMAENHLKRRASMKHAARLHPSSMTQNQSILFSDSQLYHNRAMMCDKVCRFLFPILFGMFNVIYWCHYLRV